MYYWIIALIQLVTVTSSPFESRFAEIAMAVDKAAHDHPFYPGENGVVKSAAELVSIISFESSFDPNALGDHDTSIGLAQISVSNLSWLEEQTGHPWTRDDLFVPDKNLEAAALLARASHRTCRAWPVFQGLAAYATGQGKCNVREGVMASKHRIERAQKLLREHPVRWIDPT